MQHLYKHKIPIAVATGSQRRNYEQKSAHLMDKLFGCFEGKVVCADDGLIATGRGKPCPDVFLVTARTCLEKDVGEKEDGDAEVTPEQVAERKKGLVFEDAIPGMQAGKRAGMNGASTLCFFIKSCNLSDYYPCQLYGCRIRISSRSAPTPQYQYLRWSNPIRR